MLADRRRLVIDIYPKVGKILDRWQLDSNQTLVLVTTVLDTLAPRVNENRLAAVTQRGETLMRHCSMNRHSWRFGMAFGLVVGLLMPTNGWAHLQAGDQVAVRGTDELRAGTKVQPKAAVAK